MTEHAETTEPVAGPKPGATQSGQEVPMPSPAIKEPATEARGEAAKYRTRLRETEAQRDLLTEQLTSARLSIVRQAADHTRAFNMSAFDAAGFDLASLFDEAGVFSPEQFAAQLDTIRTEKPYVFTPAGPIIPGQGVEPSAPANTNGWERAFAPQNR